MEVLPVGMDTESLVIVFSLGMAFLIASQVLLFYSLLSFALEKQTPLPGNLLMIIAGTMSMLGIVLIFSLEFFTSGTVEHTFR